MHHRLLCIDEGRQRLALLDTSDPAYGWTLDLADFPQARDLQRIGANRALVGYEHGYIELELDSGKVLHQCARWRDVSAVCRRADGSTLVTGHDLDGRGMVNLLALDDQDRLRASTAVAGDYVRLMRTTASGYLFCMNDHILETDSALAPLRRLRAEGFEHAWMALRQPDGGTLVSAGYGAFMVGFDAAGDVNTRFGLANQLPSEVAPFFYASFQQLADGRLLVANWQGHGPDNGHKGRQLLEFSARGDLLESWSDPHKISSLQGILAL